jgi:hypothetical protein
MTRVFLTVVLPLLVPTVLYIGWALLTDRVQLAGSAASWQRLPWVWLVVTGVALAAAVLLIFVQTQTGGAGSYIPPHLEDGRVVPGYIAPESPSH